MTDIIDLSHHIEKLPGGGLVLTLNTGAVIGPEEQAMLGALYSRSPGSVLQHLDTIATKGAAHFMSQFYVGYGHKSIGDCGDACVFIEGVSMLAAKAIQDFPLYNGQEVSTRYVDFSKQPFIDPINNSASEQILDGWRGFYLEALEELVPHLTEKFPRGEGESEAAYTKAIKARAFDIARAFLPAGASTNLVWVGTLRQFADRLLVLRNHPLEEIKMIALAIEKGLLETYPNSFAKTITNSETGEYEPKRYQATENYADMCQEDFAYFDPDEFSKHVCCTHNMVLEDRMKEYESCLSTRPPKTELPYRIRECGMAEFEFLLDFGSFRDLQRQRSVIIPMPLLTSDFGFEEWYLNELPELLREKAEKVIASQLELIFNLDLSDDWYGYELEQYYLPMGFRVPIRMMGDLRALVYVAELRATSLVHPTLSTKMVVFAELLLELYGRYGLVLHLDPEPGRFNVKRGEHDIVQNVS